MPLEQIEDQNAWLDAGVATLPTGGTYRLFFGIPTETQTDGSTYELPSDGGYVPAPESAATWATADGGSKGLAINFGTSTGAYGEVGTYWAYCDASGVVRLWDELDEPVEVTGAGAVVSATSTVGIVDPR